MRRKRKQRRRPHGSAWHWKQTDRWYFTQPGTKKRVALFDEDGQRIRGNENKEAAELALAREKLCWETEVDGPSAGHGQWLVARVCSEYIQYCERGLVHGTISQGHRDNSVRWLNDLCKHSGALPVVQLKKGHVKTWIESHATWHSTETHRGVIAVVLAALNRAEEMYDIANPLKGLKKPASKPRLRCGPIASDWRGPMILIETDSFACLHDGDVAFNVKSGLLSASIARKRNSSATSKTRGALGVVMLVTCWIMIFLVGLTDEQFHLASTTLNATTVLWLWVFREKHRRSLSMPFVRGGWPLGDTSAAERLAC